MSVGCFNAWPVGLDPPVHGPQRHVEGAAEIGELVESCRLNTLQIEAAGDQPVSLGPSQHVGEGFVGDAIEGIVELLVAAAIFSQLREHCESPASIQETYGPVGLLPMVSHGESSSFDLGEGVGWLELGCSSGTGCSGDEGAGDGEQDGHENGGRADVSGEVDGDSGGSARPVLLGDGG